MQDPKSSVLRKIILQTIVRQKLVSRFYQLIYSKTSNLEYDLIIVIKMHSLIIGSPIPC